MDFGLDEGSQINIGTLVAIGKSNEHTKRSSLGLADSSGNRLMSHRLTLFSVRENRYRQGFMHMIARPSISSINKDIKHRKTMWGTQYDKQKKWVGGVEFPDGCKVNTFKKNGIFFVLYLPYYSANNLISLWLHDLFGGSCVRYFAKLVYI